MSTADTDVNQVDWRQLRRWGISESRVPARHPQCSSRNLGLGPLQRSTSSARRRCCWRRRSSSPGCSCSDDGAGRPRNACAAARRRCATSYERIRDLGSRLLHAQDTERARIARELHDDISQQMALLSIDLELLSGAVPPDTEALAGEALDRAHGHCQERARSVAPAASGQAAADRPRGRASGAPARAVAVRRPRSRSRTNTCRRACRPI